MQKKAYSSSDAPAPIGPYSQAVRAGDILYISGQIAFDPATGELVMGSIEEETRQVLANLGAILRSAGLGYGHVVSCTVYISDMSLFGNINAVYAQYFSGEAPPARATVQVAGLPRNVNVEISAIAHF